MPHPFPWRFLQDFFEMDTPEAKSAASSIDEESRGEGFGLTAIEKGIVKEPIRVSRRNMLTYMASFGAAAGGYFGGKILDEATGQVLSKNFIGTINDTIEYLNFNGHVGECISFGSNFIDWINKNRQNPELLHITPQNSSEYECKFVEYINSFRSGNYLTPKEMIDLRDMLRRSEDPSTKLLVSDLLTSQLLRAGLVGEARLIFKEIEPPIRNTEEKLIYIEKYLSQAYTSIPRKDALVAEKWQFDPALESAQLLGLDEAGLVITTSECGYDLAIRGEIRMPSEGSLSGIKAFYVLQLLLHWMTVRDRADLKVLADIRFCSLAQAATIPGLERGVWNMAYFSGLMYHRIGLSTENSGQEFEIRNKFLDICFGKHDGFLPSFKHRATNNTLSIDDSAAIGLVLLVASDRETGLLKRYNNTADPKLLLASRSAIRPIAIRKAVDQLRLLTSEKISHAEAMALYGGDDHSLEIHLPPLIDIRSNLQL